MKLKSTSSHALKIGSQSDPLTFWQAFKDAMAVANR